MGLWIGLSTILGLFCVCSLKHSTFLVKGMFFAIKTPRSPADAVRNYPSSPEEAPDGELATPMLFSVSKWGNFLESR